MADPRNFPFNQSNYQRSSVNEQTVPLAAGATFTGSFVEVDQLNGLIIGYLSDVQPASVRYVWSQDGVDPAAGFDTYTVHPITFNTSLGLWTVSAVTDPPIRPFVRLEVVNGAAPQSFVFCSVFLLGSSFPGVFQSIDAPLQTFNPALQVRSVSAGATPDVGFVNLPASGVVGNNSTGAALGAGATFTGPFVSIEQYAAIAITLISNQASATDGLKIDFSDDGATVRRTIPFTYSSPGSGRGFQVPAESKYARIRYTNGGVAQASFSLQTKFTTTALQVPEVALDAVIVDTVTAALTRSIMTGKRPDLTYGNVNVDASNNLLVNSIPYSGWSKQLLVGTGAPQTVKVGPGILHAFIYSNNPNLIQAFDDPGTGVTNKFLDLANIGAAANAMPVDIAFTSGLRFLVQAGRSYTVIYS